MKYVSTKKHGDSVKDIYHPESAVRSIGIFAAEPALGLGVLNHFEGQQGLARAQGCHSGQGQPASKVFVVIQALWVGVQDSQASACWSKRLGLGIPWPHSGRAAFSPQGPVHPEGAFQLPRPGEAKNNPVARGLSCFLGFRRNSKTS